MCRVRLLVASVVLICTPLHAAAGQQEAFVREVQNLAQAAIQHKSSDINEAARRLSETLGVWDRALKDQESRVRREIDVALPQRQLQLHVELGLAYRVRGRLGDALREFDAAADLQPTSSDVQ